MKLPALLHEALGSDTLCRISKILGINQSTTDSAVRSALPMLLGALANNSSTPNGAASLLGALDRDHDGGVLDEMGGFPSNCNTSDGLKILNHIFGRNLGAVQSLLGQTIGIGAGRAGQLLAILAPVVMGALGRAQRQEGLDASLLPGYLGSASQQMGASGAKRVRRSRYRQGIIGLLALLLTFVCNHPSSPPGDKSPTAVGGARAQIGLRLMTRVGLRFDLSRSAN